MISEVGKLVETLKKLVEFKLDDWLINPAGMEGEELGEPYKKGYNTYCWKKYKNAEAITRDTIWLKKEITLPEKLFNSPTSGKIYLELKVDDSAYCWINEQPQGFFTYDEKFLLTENGKPGEKFDVTIQIMKTAGLTHLADAELKMGQHSKEIDKIERFISSLKIGEKLLSFDTYQTNFRNKFDPGIDKSLLDKDEKKRLNEKLQTLSKGLDKEVLDKQSIEGITSEIDRIAPELREIDDFAKNFKLIFAANAHIDAAWLWRWIETVEVCKTTFNAVDKMMDERKDFTYTQSSSVYYEWMEEYAPAVFEKIRNRIKQNRWEIIGGTVVEPDCNLISGESWARQLVYGKKYFRDKFNIDEEYGMNPDSFGYNANIPMIYANAGIKAFVTQKIGWNDKNVFPHRLFWWEAQDSSRILSYFPFDYDNKIRDPFTFADWIRQFEANTGLRELLILFGIGDHGGGPTPEMFERIKEINDLYIAPKIKFGSVKNYLSRLLDNPPEDTPVWKDELYLEFHQGTFTTESVLKKKNRELENKLTTAETLAVISNSPNYNNLLKKAWKKVLFNQFHDILPGSCTKEVVDDALEFYEVADSIAETVIRNSLIKLFDGGKKAKESNGTFIGVFNPSSFDRNDLIIIENTQLPQNFDFYLVDDQNSEYPLQIVKNNDIESKLICSRAIIPSMGYKVFNLMQRPITERPSKIQSPTENEFFKIEIDKDNGYLKSIFDKENDRELLRGEGFRLQLLEDKPSEWDAWNIGLTGKCFIPKFEGIEQKVTGPVFSSFILRYSFLAPDTIKSYPTKDFPSSFFDIEVILYNNIRRIDFNLTVDWHEEHTFLKAAFDFDLEEPKAIFDIPYGTIQRKQEQDKYDKAKTEMPALNFADLSETDFGIAVLNNSKSGYEFEDGTLRISLLRSPKWPDDTADMGKHHIEFSLYPHKGDFTSSDVEKKAMEFNKPMQSVFLEGEVNKHLPRTAFVDIQPDNLIITAVKFSENEDDCLMLHFYEIKGKRTKAVITLPFEPKKVLRTNLIEDEYEEVEFNSQAVDYTAEPNSLNVLKIKRS